LIMNILYKLLFFVLLFITFQDLNAQIKVLFDATKGETASNADWQIDADEFNLKYYNNGTIGLGGGEANPQRFPTPDQSTVTASTPEDYWTGANSAWGIELVQYGYQVETLPYNAQITYNDANNPQDLSNYNVFIVTEPNILFTSDEKTAIINFVQNGGGLFMTADHTNSDRNGDGSDSVDVWNDLLTNNSFASDLFGIIFNYDNLVTTTYGVANLPGNPILHGFFGDVTALELHNGASLSLNQNNNPSATDLIFDQGTGKTLFASATYGQGRVVAIGDSSPADDGTGDPHDNLYNGWYAEAGGSHRILMLNATIWLAEGGTNAIATSSESPYKVFVRDNNLLVKTADDSPIKTWQIYNIAGQNLLSGNSLEKPLNISQLKTGIYFIKIMNEKGITEIKKFFK
jgi:hypothetical protein